MPSRKRDKGQQRKARQSTYVLPSVSGCRHGPDEIPESVYNFMTSFNDAFVEENDGFIAYRAIYTAMERQPEEMPMEEPVSEPVARAVDIAVTKSSASHAGSSGQKNVGEQIAKISLEQVNSGKGPVVQKPEVLLLCPAC